MTYMMDTFAGPMFTGLSGDGYRLADLLRATHEYKIYKVRGERDIIAKVLSDLRPNERFRLEKRMMEIMETCFSSFAPTDENTDCPIDLLYDKDRNFIGYVLPVIEAEPGMACLQVFPEIHSIGQIGPELKDILENRNSFWEGIRFIGIGKLFGIIRVYICGIFCERSILFSELRNTVLV